MGPGGTMTSTSEFTMGTIKQHVHRAIHHVKRTAHKIHALVKGKLGTPRHTDDARHSKKHAKAAQVPPQLDLAKVDFKTKTKVPVVTKAMIDKYVMDPETLKKKSWTKAIAREKAKYYYDHQKVFLMDKAGQFDNWTKEHQAKTHKQPLEAHKKRSEMQQPKKTTVKQVPATQALRPGSAKQQQQTRKPTAKQLAEHAKVDRMVHTVASRAPDPDHSQSGSTHHMSAMVFVAHICFYTLMLAFTLIGAAVLAIVVIRR